MPKDSAGKFHLNSQKAAHSDKMSMGRNGAPPPPAAKMTPGATPHEGGGADRAEINKNPDGSYHSMAGGQKTEHPTLGHALMHVAAHHEPEGTHVHGHHDGMSVNTHHVSEGGEVEGPNEHESPEEAGQHMASVMSGDGGGAESEGQDMGSGMGMAGMHALRSMA